MKFPEGFLNELVARVDLELLVGKQVSLRRDGRVLKGCCPFHQENTPTLFVYPEHFHCFGCGSHGDALGFFMASQDIEFAEAVWVRRQ
jgi:DNA primase